jgi:hypothetical protein
VRGTQRWLAAIAVVPFFVLAQNAQAQLAPTYEYTQDGFGSPGVAYVLPVPGTYNYGNSYHSPGEPIEDDLGEIDPPVSFYDGYEFTVGGAVANSATITIDLGGFLGIDNLSARIFRADGNTPPTLRTPVGGSLIERWSTPIDAIGPDDGEAVILSNVVLAPGTYVLQIRGIVTGDPGGSYAGVLNLAALPPVPIPAAGWLLISGLGALRLVCRREALNRPAA